MFCTFGFPADGWDKPTLDSEKLRYDVKIKSYSTSLSISTAGTKFSKRTC